MPLFYTTLSFKKEFNSDYLGEKMQNLLDTTFVIPQSYSYNIFEVTEEYIARPDLISYDAYGDSMYADVLCKLNGISNPFELNQGMTLIIPSPDNIMDFVINPPSSEHESESVDSYKEGVYNSFNSGNTNGSKNGGDLLVGKTKQSKRRANEAILGDSRFKINTADGIIIY